MSEPFIGEIRMLAGYYAPAGWAFCDGQIQAIAQNKVLYSLLGTTYGGDGENSFALPDLRGRVPLHCGSGPGLSSRQLGATGGQEDVTLTINELTSHSHNYNASPLAGDQGTPPGNVVAGRTGDPTYIEDIPDTNLAGASIVSTGGNQSHTNLMPTLCVNFIIALLGINPSGN